MSNNNTIFMIDEHERSRKALGLYEHMKSPVAFNCIYGYKSTMHNGVECACIKDVRDPITHEVIVSHTWVPITKAMDSTLNIIKKESPIIINAKVIKYTDKKGVHKFGLRPMRINLIPNYKKRFHIE